MRNKSAVFYNKYAKDLSVQEKGYLFVKFPIATRFIFLRDCVMFSQNTKVFESLIASSINLRSLFGSI